MEAGWWSPSASPPPPPRAPPPRCRCRHPFSTSYTCLPHYDGWPDGEEESTGGALRERELRSLHRTIPALRRRELDTRAIKHHFYPEGGWGWIVCGAAFLAHLLSTGLQLAYGALHVYALKHLGPTADHAGVVLGIGCGLVREAAGLVLGAYFRRRRQFVELVAHAGGGVGIALFSVAYKEAVGKLGWRLGLQAVTGVLVLAFFLSAVYRSASLYHPQRRAILHLKNQRRKVKEKKGIKRPPLIDLSPLQSRPAKVLLLAAGLAAFGLYTPVFFLALQGFQEGLEESALVLLQTFLGFAAVLGCAGFGLVLVRPSAQCLVSKQYLCQTAMLGIGISMLALSSVEGYHGYVLFAWMYGLCLGGYLYSLKMLTMERVRGRHFTKVWGYVQGAEAIPVIVGVPVTGYINQQAPRAGFYFSTAATLAGAFLLFFVGFSKREPEPPPPAAAPSISESCRCTSPLRCGAGGAWCACGAGGAAAYCAWPGPACGARLPKSLSYAAPLDRACCSATHCPDCYRQTVPLRSSRSVPEGLATRTSSWGRAGSCRGACRRREHHLIEQITTSV
ncbi:monocarboxylate transporter 4-like isoform X2 [Bombyx mandarina]|uniref:Monocarboxylate transporter 4-like isoform X2 n=1 Tax=Bombyx mandarina TaxID=7092 RepID=A0A6J2KMY3_BOMMA|nr:monocarboxylate transporter 4-like isoform X2 [Bombyx mandarina]